MSKKVPITEEKLIDLIDNIVSEAKAEWLNIEKKKWISETKIEIDKKLIEKIEKLETTLKKLL